MIKKYKKGQLKGWIIKYLMLMMIIALAVMKEYEVLIDFKNELK